VLEPRRAPVQPRVISPFSGETLLLEDEIRSLLERGERGLVWLVGGPGSGKTTALRHLVAVLPPEARVTLLDENVPNLGAHDNLTVGTGIAGTAPKNAFAVYELAPWTDDEIIEYLLATNRECIPSVVRRCNSGNDRECLRGNPELWRNVLDVLAADENVLLVKDALRQVVSARLPDQTSRDLASNWCLAILMQDAELAKKYRQQLEAEYDFQSLLRLLWHVPVILLLGAEAIAKQLASGNFSESLAIKLPRELVEEVAGVIRHDQLALGHLKGLLVASRRTIHPMAASILHAARIGWRPETRVTPAWRKLLPRQKFTVPLLRGAYLAKAAWTGLSLAHVDFSDCDLKSADLSNATLDFGDAYRAWLVGANMSGASVIGFRAASANLSGADLSYLRAPKSSFDDAEAQGSRFEGALLRDASFRRAKLAGANFTRANLTRADLVDAEIEGADFSQAELTGALLTGLILRLADFRQCNFCQADMSACDLEGMVLPGADFSAANLKGALLTGTVMPRANFQGASLANTGLAEIDWEQADLRDADLRGASFHMGSSRSGLIDSPIASYGSRTGFYTDDYNEQDFKSPEEIRKANLRGADLRGVTISGVDFYLVDLRDAHYDALQEQHFRSCGAILESRVW